MFFTIKNNDVPLSFNIFDKTTEIGLGNIEFIGCLGYCSFIDDRFNIFIVTVNKALSLMTKVITYMLYILKTILHLVNMSRQYICCV